MKSHKIFSLLATAAIIFSSVCSPFVKLAHAEETPPLSTNQIVYEGGENDNVWSTDGVKVSKTIEGTDTEDFFDITLQVKTKKTTDEILENEAVAVVMVIDLSNTMNSNIKGNTDTWTNSKAKAASDAAGKFAQMFYDASTSYSNNVLGAVGFNTNGQDLVNATPMNSQANVNRFKSTSSSTSQLENRIKSIVTAGDYNSSTNRYTNIEAGLKKARTMLNNCPQKYKFIVFLSDGLPTTYTTSTSATNYTGYNPTSLKDGLNKNRSLVGGNYSDTGAKRARSLAMTLKNSGITIFSIGVGLSTFDGWSGKASDGTYAPFGQHSENLNGEKFLMNEIGRSVLVGDSTVEDTFSNITSGNTGGSVWRNNKSAIYNLNWEIRNNYNPANMSTTPRYKLSETAVAGQPALFENWLQYGIGSGFYYDVTSTAGLNNAVTEIFEEVDAVVFSKRPNIWATLDPMSSYDSLTGSLQEYIEFKGFIDSDGTLKQSLTGTAGQNNTNTASITKSTSDKEGTIYWDLKHSGYSIVQEDGTNVYVYSLKYRVRLKTDKQGFVANKAYDSNGRTTLTYITEENGVTSDEKTIDYPIPKVKGFLTELKITKNIEGLAPGMSFTNDNAYYQFVVTLKNADGNPSKNTFTYDKYNRNGTQDGNTTNIKSGDTITLGDGQYAIIHSLYHDLDYAVSETRKDGFVSTITSGSETGTTHSDVPLNQVVYHNKAYYLTMNKVDESTGDPLVGVKFSLYRNFTNGIPSGIVTNMNGTLLKDLLTSDEEGKEGIIELGNLSFTYGGSTTYYLVEEDTIDKYDVLDNYVEITVSADGIVAKYDGEVMELNQDGNGFTVTVPNARGIDLPETGGAGSTIFILLGISVMILSGVTFVANKKVNKGKEGTMKKYLKVLLSFLLALTVSATANAETTFKVEINNDTAGHTYEAYQIFTGDLSTDKTTLSNIQWGSGVKDEFKAAHTDAKAYAESIVADAVAKATELGNNLSSTVAGSTSTMESGVYTISGLTPGYYLIKDKDGTQTGNDDAYTEYIVKLVGDATVDVKTGKPTADKKINEGDDVVYSANYAVGDQVPYVLTGTLPSNYASYTTYKYIFHDTLSSGLTYDDGSTKVYVDGTEITTGFTVNYASNELTISFADTKAVSAITKDSTITVEYTATVNDDAVRGLPGNENTLYIEFSNNPYKTDTGKTVEIENKVYIFDLIFNKIDSKTGEAVYGAGFTLYRKVDGQWVEWATVVDSNKNNNVFTFSGLSVGTYKLVESTTPDKYNTLSDVEFEVTADFDEDGLSSLSGTKFSFTADLDEGSLTADVKNVKGVELPLTGGYGSIVFVALGLIIMTVSAVLFVKNKKVKD